MSRQVAFQRATNLSRAEGSKAKPDHKNLEHVRERTSCPLLKKAIDRFARDTRAVVSERKKNLATGRRVNDAAWFSIINGKNAQKVDTSPHKYKLEWLDDHRNFDAPECLLFPCSKDGAPNRVSYNYKQMSVARAMLLKTQGLPKISNAHAAHKCGNGHLSCVNPAHLYWATAKQNAQDKMIHDDTDLTKYEVSEDVAEAIRSSDKMASVLAHETGLPVALVNEVRRHT